MASEESSVKPADKARFKSYLKKLTSFKFVLHMLFFESLLNPLAALSCHLQGNSADLPFALSSLEAFHTAFQTLLVDDPEKPTELYKFVTAAEDQDHPHFRDVKLYRVQPNVLTTFCNSRAEYIEKIRDCLNGRFEDLERDIFKTVRLLDTKLWPTDKERLTNFGVADLSLAIDHFRPLLLQNDVSLDGTLADWSSFKVYWMNNLQDHQRDDVWSLLLTYYGWKFPNLAHLVQILLLFPISNAKVERGFSAMRRIKSDWRSSLDEDTLDHLMRICIDGPPLDQFDPRLAVQKFFNTPRRTDVQPYGSRKRKNSDTN